jgi:ribonuclease P/MRP protein subunit POP5
LFSEKNFDDRSVERAIFSVFLGLFGSTGVAKQNLRLMRYNNGSNLGILRCSLETVEQTKAGLLFLKTVNGFPVAPKILSVSGSIKKLKSKR